MAGQKHSAHDGQCKAHCSRGAVQSIEKEGQYRAPSAEQSTVPQKSRAEHSLKIEAVQSTVPREAVQNTALEGQCRAQCPRRAGLKKNAKYGQCRAH